MNRLFKRSINEIIAERIREPRNFIQVIIGPRQVGKTTAVNQVIESINISSHYASADRAALEPIDWIERQWEIARQKSNKEKEALLVLDEIQKIANWSTVVKSLWDEDTLKKRNLKVILLGSSPLLMQTGLSESLAGRFEIIPATHWSFSECKKYFGWEFDTYIYFGGYPGAAKLIEDRARWANYIEDSLVETSVSRDILLMTRVDKPALLRQLFFLGCEYSGKIISYQKLLGQLQDAKNTTTIAHYLRLLTGAGLIAGLEKYSGSAIRRRGSSPKMLVYNTALITAQQHLTLNEAKEDGDFWGRLVESAVGAHILNLSLTGGIKAYYWRKQDDEVDFVVQYNNEIIAIEVKGGEKKKVGKGMASFSKMYSPSKKLLIGGQGIPVADFLLSKPSDWLR